VRAGVFSIRSQLSGAGGQAGQGMTINEVEELYCTVVAWLAGAPTLIVPLCSERGSDAHLTVQLYPSLAARFLPEYETT
jgi:hypothetical protein